MTTLGEILGQLQDTAEIHQLLAGTGDLILVARLEKAADAAGCNACEFALQVVRTFSERASDDAWVKLIGRLQNSEAPAATCLCEMIEWSLTH